MTAFNQIINRLLAFNVDVVYASVRVVVWVLLYRQHAGTNSTIVVLEATAVAPAIVGCLLRVLPNLMKGASVGSLGNCVSLL